MLASTDPRIYDPYRRPDWRFERVLQLADRQPVPGRCTKRDDDTIRSMKSFLLRWRGRSDSGRQELLHENPGLYYAYQLHENESDEHELEFMLQSRLLSGQDPEEIAVALGTLTGAVTWYEKVFFNVLDRLENHDWIVKRVLLPAAARNVIQAHPGDDGEQQGPRFTLVAKPFLDWSLKWFSYFGGPVVCEWMIGGFKRGSQVTRQEDIDAFVDEHWSSTIRRRSAQAAGIFEVNKYNVMELFHTHSQIMSLERSTDTVANKKTDLEHHINHFLGSLPWAVGVSGREQFSELSVGEFDEVSAELRSDELMLVAASDDATDFEHLKDVELPHPVADEEK